MTVLFYFASHFNADMIGPQLEMVQNHINKGDKVTILACHKELSSCNVNYNQSALTCAICKSNLNAGLKSLAGNFLVKRFNDVLPFSSIDTKHNNIQLNSLAAFKELYIGNFDIGMACTSSLNTILRDPNPDLIKHKKLVYSIWDSALWTYQLIEKELTHSIYDAVYVFNGRVATLRSCLRACEKTGTSCLVLEAGYQPFRYAIYNNALPHNIKNVEQLIEENWENYPKNKEEDAEFYYFNRSKGKDLLNGKFSKHQVEGQLPKNWDNQKRNISIFVSSEDEFVSIGKEWSNPLFQSQSEGISAILKAFENDSSFHFYIRIHPNLYGVFNESTKAMHLLEKNNSTLILARDKVNSYSLLNASEKVISFGSSVGIEAAAAEKISLLIANCFYSNLGSTYNPSTVEELMALIRQKELPILPKLGALKYGLFLANFGENYTHFKLINHFKGTMNGNAVRPFYPIYLMRLIGRKLRLRKFAQQQVENQNKLDEIYTNSIR